MLRIEDELFSRTDPRLTVTLASIHGTQVRPFCTCRPGGIEMYVAKVAGRYAVKRMPHTGPTHAPDCDSYEAPPELSGLGQLVGSAIDEDAEAGLTTLKLGFSLAKGLSQAARLPQRSDENGATAKTDGRKLSLRGTLHYLWEQAGFNKWSPAMDGKRSWGVVRKYLLLAAENKLVKGVALVDRLYIPEPFRTEKKAEIAQRRVATMVKATVAKGPRPLLIVVGEVAEIGKSRFGFKMRFKHVPDCDFMMHEDLHARLRKRFVTEFELWDANAAAGAHLMAIATFGVSGTGVPTFEEVALMTVSRDWIPYENQFELLLLGALVENKRRFTKGLRYNLGPSTPLATAVLADTGSQPTALYILPFGASDPFVAELGQLVATSQLQSWRWELGSADMPALPPAVSGGSAGKSGLTCETER